MIVQHGGLYADPLLQTRGEALINDLADAWPIGVGPMPNVAVLDDARPVAFAVAPHRVYLTRGLLAGYPEELTRAAIAHELGHLIEDHSAHAVTALLGQPCCPDPEHRADQLGQHLLSTAGLDPLAMTRLLDRLSCEPRLDAPTRARMRDRAALSGTWGQTTP